MGKFLILSLPRSGSNYLESMLRCHDNITVATGELFTDDNGFNPGVLSTAARCLSSMRTEVKGLKTFCEQLIFQQISLEDVVRTLNISHIIVLSRNNCLETYCSLKIATRTDVWYSEAQPEQVETIEINATEFKTYLDNKEAEWKQVIATWPPDVVPIFVTYETLVKNPDEEMKRILLALSQDPTDYEFIAACCRQNPAAIENKVTNFAEIDESLINARHDVRSWVEHAIAANLNVSVEMSHLVPDREPPRPPDGYRYSVSVPFLPSGVRQNILDAIDTVQVSSAGCWPKMMQQKLKLMFDSPVVQPCCNGFAAIVLTLLAADVKPDDEVIIPTFTMIAVVNAIRFVGAVCALADNSSTGSYNPGLQTVLAASTLKTKAVIVCHTYGVPTEEIEKIQETCQQRNWVLIEDISECVGISTSTNDGKTRLLGTFGNFACASMYANKLVHGGDAGFVLAKDAKAAARLTSLTNHGFTPSYHFVHLEPAPNFKINGLAAAIACAVLDETGRIMEHRRQMSQTYRQHLARCPLQLMPSCGPFDTPWVFGVQCSSKEERAQLRSWLASHGIETRNFFFPIHAQPAYRKRGISKATGTFLFAEQLSLRAFYLPSYTDLTETDITCICSVIVAFFDQSKAVLPFPERDLFIKSIRLRDDQLGLEMRYLARDGSHISSQRLDQSVVAYKEICGVAEHFLKQERWDTGRVLLRQIAGCMADMADVHYPRIDKVLQHFANYIESHRDFEPSVEEPWRNEDVDSGEFEPFRAIPTSSQIEVLQFLSWLIKHHQAKTILELGTWLGRATGVLAVSAKQVHTHAKVYTVDEFKWQTWMKAFDPTQRRLHRSYIDIVSKNLKTVSNTVEIINCNILTAPWPKILNEIMPDMVSLDFAQSAQELESLWVSLKPTLISNHTIVVINNVTSAALPFIVSHNSELVSMYTPRGTRVKAFRYVDQLANYSESENVAEPRTVTTSALLGRKLNFCQNPNWGHHNRNAFVAVINVLQQRLHSEQAAVDFIPAIEEYLCDFQSQVTRPWIGIVHAVQRDDVFYPPDLERLCSERYAFAMKLCKGLFTLTQFQAQYLKENLPKTIPIPICPLKYPFLPSSYARKSSETTIWEANGTLDLVFIGSFARDFDAFFNVKVSPKVRKVLVVGDALSAELAVKAPPSVAIVQRLSDEEYDALLSKSVVFLALKFHGAANTVVLECIARNVPIVAPRIDSCTEYLGADYPLLYDPNDLEICNLLSQESLSQAIAYLAAKDKECFSIEHFCKTVMQSAVLLNIPPHNDPPTEQLMIEFDVTVCICSYKRTHNIEQILASLLKHQENFYSIQIILWNNNEARQEEVNYICRPFLQTNTNRRSLEVIHSTRNHYCIVRACMAQLMSSQALLICDDDIIPGPQFVRFFLENHSTYPDDVLGCRGHIFLPHKLDVNDPARIWTEYSHIRFVNDSQTECFVHFLHADACLIPRSALRELCATPLPDEGFILVDDYWMCFLLNSQHNRALRKLQCARDEVFVRTLDSDTENLALYTRAEVQDAKIRMYIYHMMHGWPRWEKTQEEALNNETSACKLATKTKIDAWQNKFIGFNISSNISFNDAADLADWGVQYVRIGAVNSREEPNYEFHEFLMQQNCIERLNKLLAIIDMLNTLNIKVVLTLRHNIATPRIWELIAKHCRQRSNVIGYDVINEPFVDDDLDKHFTDVVSSENYNISQYCASVTELIRVIRLVDNETPIVLQPTFWGQSYALKHLTEYCKLQKNVLMSVHFYEPRKLTSRSQNKGRYVFPGLVPLFHANYSEDEMWTAQTIDEKIASLRQWQDQSHTQLFIGEFGISRETRGASEYLTAVSNACIKHGLSAFVYTYRESCWDAMDYELGPYVGATYLNVRQHPDTNPLVRALKQAVLSARDCAK